MVGALYMIHHDIIYNKKAMKQTSLNEYETLKRQLPISITDDTLNTLNIIIHLS